MTFIVWEWILLQWVGVVKDGVRKSLLFLGEGCDSRRFGFNKENTKTIKYEKGINPRTVQKI